MEGIYRKDYQVSELLVETIDLVSDVLEIVERAVET